MIAAIYARKSTERTPEELARARAELDCDVARVLGALLVKWYRADVAAKAAVDEKAIAGGAGGHDG